MARSVPAPRPYPGRRPVGEARLTASGVALRAGLWLLAAGAALALLGLIGGVFSYRPSLPYGLDTLIFTLGLAAAGLAVVCLLVGAILAALTVRRRRRPATRPFAPRPPARGRAAKPPLRSA